MDKDIEYKSLDADYCDNFGVAPIDMVAYTEPRSLQDIKLMKDGGSLKIDPDFQRNIVWPAKYKSLFIDSLYRQLPIPSMCFSYDYKTRERMVIDGLQRVSTILEFMSNDNFKIMDLPEIHRDIAGKTTSELKAIPDGKTVSPYTDIINVTIPITVLRSDFSLESNMEYLYKVFQRLNQGSVTLSPQEIRNCAYQGPFNNMLKILNGGVEKHDGNQDWTKIVEADTKIPYRMRNEERTLRFFAFYDSYKEYTGAMTKFLDSYMRQNRNLAENLIAEKKCLFEETVAIAANLDLTNRQSWAIKESILIGLAKNLDIVKTQSTQELNNKVAALLSSEEFSEESTKWAVFSKDKTINRLEKAIMVFAA